MTSKNDYQLQNYIKLSNVINNTKQKLKENETLISKDILFNSCSNQTKIIYTFNTLIASGYNAICYVDDKELIKTNFDFASNNKDVLLDFNIGLIAKLVESNTGETQTKLI